MVTPYRWMMITWVLCACSLAGTTSLTAAAANEDLISSLQGVSDKRGSDDSSLSPNDLFWANRGKKSGYSQQRFPKPHQFLMPVVAAAKRVSDSGVAFAPNRMVRVVFPRGLQQQERRGKRTMRMRPNGALIPPTHYSGKRDGGVNLWNVARPNSHLFPSMKQGKRFGSSNNMDETFFAGRGKRFYEDDEEEEWSESAEKRGDFDDEQDEDVYASFFAGRGKRDE